MDNSADIRFRNMQCDDSPEPNNVLLWIMGVILAIVIGYTFIGEENFDFLCFWCYLKALFIGGLVIGAIWYIIYTIEFFINLFRD